MNTPPCCRHRRLLRVRSVTEWLLPGAVLALLPKCPFCLAAYVALGTGLAITPASATVLLRALTTICIGALALRLAKRIMKHRRRSFPLNLHPTHPLS